MSKLIPLTQGKFAIVDDEDFDFVNSFHWHFCPDGYAVRNHKKTCKVYLHHVLIGYPLNKKQTDHINGDRLDNRKENLRILTNRGNCQNRHIKGKGVVGVHKTGKKGFWKSEITFEGKRHHLGHFKNKDDAHQAYIFACNLIGQPVIT